MSGVDHGSLVGTADAAAPTLQARALGVAKYQIVILTFWGATGPVL